MATTAITYRTGESRAKLRTVIVEDFRGVTLVSGTELVLGKLVHGTTCAHKFWEDELGVTGDDFGVERDQVTQVREISVGVKAVHK